MFSGSSGADYQDTVIENDGFWPNLNAGDFEKRRGLPAAQDPERIATAIANATAEVNLQLEMLKTQYMSEGINQAEDIIAFPKIGNRNRVVIQYESAINARAKADLLPDIATLHQRKEGDHLADRSEETKNELLAESQRIIRNMCGLNRSTVTLI